jgi:hypothetical protein
MPKSFFIHSLFLLSAIILTWFWTSNPGLSLYNLQLIALFVIFYFLSHFLSKSAFLTSTIDAIIFTIVILLLVTSTGGLSSPLFFLIYFLLFAVSLLFEPAITLVLTAAIFVFFWPSPLVLNSLIQLLSVLLILPLSVFLGRQYLKVLEAHQEIKILKKESQKLEKSITSEETDSLLWLSLNLKEGLLQIIHLTADLLSGLGYLTLTQKEKLEKIHQIAKDLLKSGQKLKEKIDRETD